jgi:hypothetical protein
MTTSGTSSFNVVRDDIIKAAARKIGAIRATQTPNAQMVTDFAQALNALVKHWQAKGLHVWTETEATLFPQAGQTRYAISDASSSDHATQSYVATLLSAVAASSATTITVDSITGISSGDHIGVVLDDGTVHWTTVNGAPSGSTITLTTGLADSASADAHVYAYTTKIVRPLKIVDARWQDADTGIESPVIEMIARLKYRQLPTKTEAGATVSAFYDPQLTTGYLNLWHVPDPFEGFVNFTWWRPIMDFNAAGDNPDLPQEWIRTMMWNLALEMAPEFDVPAQKFQIIQAMAAQSLEEVEGWDREEESAEFAPDMYPR